VAAFGFCLAQAQSFAQLHLPSLSQLQLFWAHAEQVMDISYVGALRVTEIACNP
jgi:hypothetical protein